MRRTILVALVFSLALFCSRGFARQIPAGPYEHMGFMIGRGVANPPAPSVPPAEQLKTFQAQFIANDPWRIFKGATNYVCKDAGEQFEGVVVAVGKNRIWLDGWHSKPLTYAVFPYVAEEKRRFLLINFPHPVRIGQLLSRNERLVAFVLSAEESRGLIAPNPATQTSYFQCLDYGQVIVPGKSASSNPTKSTAQTGK